MRSTNLAKKTKTAQNDRRDVRQPRVAMHSQFPLLLLFSVDQIKQSRVLSAVRWITRFAPKYRLILW